MLGTVAWTRKNNLRKKMLLTILPLFHLLSFFCYTSKLFSFFISVYIFWQRHTSLHLCPWPQGKVTKEKRMQTFKSLVIDQHLETGVGVCVWFWIQFWLTSQVFTSLSGMFPQEPVTTFSHEKYRHSVWCIIWPPSTTVITTTTSYAGAFPSRVCYKHNCPQSTDSHLYFCKPFFLLVKTYSALYY